MQMKCYLYYVIQMELHPTVRKWTLFFESLKLQITAKRLEISQLPIPPVAVGSQTEIPEYKNP